MKLMGLYERGCSLGLVKKSNEVRFQTEESFTVRKGKAMPLKGDLEAEKGASYVVFSSTMRCRCNTSSEDIGSAGRALPSPAESDHLLEFRASIWTLMQL